MSLSESFQAPDELDHIIGWLRPDPRRRLIPAWGLAVLLVLIGAGLCAVFFLSEETGGRVKVGEAAPILLFGGLLSILLGMLTMVVNAIKVLQDERSVAFLSDGLLYSDVRGEISEMLWRDVESVKVSEPSSLRAALEVSLHSGRYVTLRLEWLNVDLELFKRLLLDEQRRYLMGVPHQVNHGLSKLKLTLSRNAVFNTRALRARNPRS